MVPPTVVPKTHGPAPKVGTRVRVRRGSHSVEVRVVEDRGNLGAGGERLALVATPADVDLDEASTFEVPVSSLEP